MPLTLFGRALSLVAVELIVNGVCWAFAARSHAMMALAILAWTIGLRHALDADHIRSFGTLLQIVAIDNATRTLLSHGQLAITCGLFFSLGHSTIVIVVNIAILVSANIYNKLGGVGNVGSTVGTAISGSFLFIVGLANAIILCRILRKRQTRDSEHGERDSEPASNQNMLMMRLLGPLVNFVDRPWKMYPVGVLFGLGFDTASSIALLAISALAKNGKNDTRIHPSDVVILPLLFTTGMTLVDSLDSILMLYSYTGFADHSWKIFKSTPKTGQDASENEVDIIPRTDQSNNTIEEERRKENAMGQPHKERMVLVKQSTMSHLSIILTTMSILLAFGVSLIEIMGLIGQKCGACHAAASAPDGGGLAGAWWRAWAVANENYGYIGAGIVGVFAILVGGWYVFRMFM